jgi:KDO2-lipid IV(A) lauroyltransferase
MGRSPDDVARSPPDFRIGLLRGIALLPLPVLHLTGAALGTVLSFLPLRLRTMVDINLALCFPEQTPAWRRRLRRRAMAHLGRLVFESGKVWSADRQGVQALVRETHGEALIGEALTHGGAIVATPHLGCWEMVSNYLSIHYPLTALYRPQKGELDRWIRERRQRLGAHLEPADQGGVRALMAALRRRELAGLLPDQDPNVGGTFVSHFGQLTNTPVLLARLAHKGKVPVILCFAERLPWGQGYCIHFEQVAPGVADPDAQVGTQVLSDAVEALIRRYPEQYFWNYQRFRRRPPGEPRIYPRRPRPR